MELKHKIGDNFECTRGIEKVKKGDIVEVVKIEIDPRNIWYKVKNLNSSRRSDTFWKFDTKYWRALNKKEEPVYKVGDIYKGDLRELKPLSIEEAKKVKKGQLLIYLDNSMRPYLKSQIVESTLDGLSNMRSIMIKYIDDRGEELEDGWPLIKFALLPQNSELEELVKKANEGRKAILKLAKKYPNKVQFDRVMDTGILNEERNVFVQHLNKYGDFEIIPEKPKFEPFTTKEGWRVALKHKYDNDYVAIGCRKNIGTGNLGTYAYNAAVLKRVFRAIIRKNCNHYTDSESTAKFEATKNGIRQNKEILNWDDAERILKQLEEIDA
jgi:hypothetical protein